MAADMKTAGCFRISALTSMKDYSAETGNRTRYLRITSAPLCHVSYLGDSLLNIFRERAEL